MGAWAILMGRSNGKRKKTWLQLWVEFYSGFVDNSQHSACVVRPILFVYIVYTTISLPFNDIVDDKHLNLIQ